MGTFADRLARVWYGGAPVPWWLATLVPLYRALRALHLAPYRYGWRTPRAAGVPLIVVGNLTVGGSGKTPVVVALVEALLAQGRRPGVVSRGYGGSLRGPLRLEATHTPAEVGDEPVLIRERTGVPVAIGRDRAQAAALLCAAGVDVIVADDGLQNPALRRDLEICVIDGARRFGNGRLLPAGPLREATSRLETVAFRVCNGGVALAGEVPMRLVGDRAIALAGGAARPLAAFAGQRVHAVAAIGRPERFFEDLRARGIDVLTHAFPDHHAFVADELTFGDALPVLMTEKDAVKCRAFALADCWCVPVRAELPAAFLDAVAARVRTC